MVDTLDQAVEEQEVQVVIHQVLHQQEQHKLELQVDQVQQIVFQIHQ
jgi:hypothetical protein